MLSTTSSCREKAQIGELNVERMNSADNTADLFTKALPLEVLKRRVPGLGMSVADDYVTRYMLIIVL